jgi:PIN domain nuclease of toxin-antitoxin system
MAFLLDTHTFLWFVAGDKQLPPTVRDKIKDIKQPCFLSVASLWEETPPIANVRLCGRAFFCLATLQRV